MIKTELWMMKGDSAETIIDKYLDMFIINATTKGLINTMIEELLCPTPGKVPDAIQTAYEWAKSISDADLNKNVNDWLDSMHITAEMRASLPCEQNYHITIMKVGIDFMMQWSSASDRREICE